MHAIMLLATAREVSPEAIDQRGLLLAHQSLDDPLSLCALRCKKTARACPACGSIEIPSQHPIVGLELRLGTYGELEPLAELRTIVARQHVAVQGAEEFSDPRQRICGRQMRIAGIHGLLRATTGTQKSE